MSSYQEFSERTRRRRRKQRFGLFLAFVVLTVLILGVAYLVVKIAGILYPQEKPTENFAPVSSLEEVLEQLDPEYAQQQGDAVTAGQKVGEGPQLQTGDAAQLTNPDFRMIALPENGRVDMCYFDDATFIGDSLTQGISLYNGNTFPGSDIAAWKGCSPMTLLDRQMTQPDGTTVDALDYIVSTAPAKVYLLLGSNALTSQTDEVILKYYEKFLDALGERLPGVMIYIQSIPTVVREEEAARAKKGQDFSRERINGINDQLAKMAYVRGIYFINLQEALCTDDGYLNPDYNGGDGLHLNAAGYRAWRDYLITHTAHRWDNPYIVGSPYFVSQTNDDWLNGAQPVVETLPEDTGEETSAEGQEATADGTAVDSAEGATEESASEEAAAQS